MAAPTELRTLIVHRAKEAHQECGWKGGNSGNMLGKMNEEDSFAQKTRIRLTQTGLLMEGHIVAYSGYSGYITG